MRIGVSLVAVAVAVAVAVSGPAGGVVGLGALRPVTMNQ